MSRDLYFIPIIEKALRAKDIDKSLREAFVQIIKTGREPGYVHAFLQFQRFMEDVKNAHSLIGEDKLADRSVEAEAHESPMQIILEKEGRVFGTCWFDSLPGRCSIKHILPGAYRVKLETGRIVWEGSITEEDCIWIHAYPGQPLNFAADTGDDERQPSRAVSVLGGAILLHFYPGIETGVLAIELREAGGE